MKTFTTKNPNYAARVRDSFDRQPMLQTLGVTLADVQPGYCEIHLPLRHELTQHHGYLHGGAYALLADTVAGYAAYSLLSEHESALTVEYKLNMLRPGIGTKFIARGRVIQRGRLLCIVQADVYALHEGEEKHCVTSLQTIMVMAEMADNSNQKK